MCSRPLSQEPAYNPLYKPPPGFPLEVNRMFCGICGKKNPDDAVRCEACGNIIAPEKDE